MKHTVSTADTNIEWGLTGEDRIVQNVLNLIRTKKFEVPFSREMGIDPEYIDSNISYAYNGLVNDIIDLVEEYESRATVTNVVIDGYDDNGNLIIKLDLEV